MLVGSLRRGNKIHSIETCRFYCVCRKIRSHASEKSSSAKNERFPCYGTADSREISCYLLRYIGIQYVILITSVINKVISIQIIYFIVKKEPNLH